TFVLGHHISNHPFGGIRVRHSNDADFEYLFVAPYDILNLIGIHVKSRHEDHLLFPINDLDEAIFINHSYISSFKPLANKNLLGFFRPIPIPLHYLRPPHAKLTFFSNRQSLALTIHNLYFRIRQWQSYRAQPLTSINRVTGYYW